MPTPAKSRTARKPAARASKTTGSRSQKPSAADLAFYLGQVAPFAFGFAPIGWMPCQGQLLRITQYQDLFSLLGTTYGGNGVSTFALPKLAPIASGGPSYYIATVGVYPSRQ